MQISILKEAGYEEAVLGFSLSYNATLERTRLLLPKYAFGIPGESKFLESITVWLDVTAPRFWWQEADTYRVGSTKQSESTMHTLRKSHLSQDNFEYNIPDTFLSNLNVMLASSKDWEDQSKFLAVLKSMLPEGFLQRRIWTVNYKTLQNMYNQRHNHRLPQWRLFCDTLLSNLEHPEFIVKDYTK